MSESARSVAERELTTIWVKVSREKLIDLQSLVGAFRAHMPHDTVRSEGDDLIVAVELVGDATKLEEFKTLVRHDVGEIVTKPETPRQTGSRNSSPAL